MEQLGKIIACLTIPILWGWMVNWLFVQWGRRRNGNGKRAAEVDDETFIDYQI